MVLMLEVLFPPDLAMQMAKQFKIKVYTLGIGSEKEIDEVLESPLGHIRQKRKLEFNEGLFQDLAGETGGQYFHATDNDALQKIYTSINQLEKQKLKLLFTIGTKINFKPGSLLELFFCCWKLYCDILRLESFHDYFR
jgi:hypothetical protein